MIAYRHKVVDYISRSFLCSYSFAHLRSTTFSHRRTERESLFYHFDYLYCIVCTFTRRSKRKENGNIEFICTRAHSAHIFGRGKMAKIQRRLIMIFQFECAPYIWIGEGFPPQNFRKVIVEFFSAIEDGRLVGRFGRNARGDGDEIGESEWERDSESLNGLALHCVTSNRWSNISARIYIQHHSFSITISKR